MKNPGILRIFAIPLAAAVICAGAVRATVIRLYEVPTGSMRPLLEPGDLIAATPAGEELERGDVIVFRTADGRRVVKRVIALPGDHVTQSDGSLRLNGRELFEPYVLTSTSSGDFCELVPSGHVWVLGDNRTDSVDSRAIGPVPVTAIESKVRWVVYSRN